MLYGFLIYTVLHILQVCVGFPIFTLCFTLCFTFCRYKWGSHFHTVLHILQVHVGVSHFHTVLHILQVPVGFPSRVSHFHTVLHILQVHVGFPVFFMIIMTFLILFPLFYSPFECLMGLFMVATGIPVYCAGVLWTSKPNAVKNWISEYSECRVL